MWSRGASVPVYGDIVQRIRTTQPTHTHSMHVSGYYTHTHTQRLSVSEGSPILEDGGHLYRVRLLWVELLAGCVYGRDT